MTDSKNLFKHHDSLFLAAFGSKEEAARLLRSVLPATLAARIDFDSLEPLSTKLTGPHLEARHTDLLFSAKLGEQDVWIYVLLEHQSTGERFMLARLLTYVSLAYEGYLRAEKAQYLPVIVPVVVHHSEQGWSAPTKFEELVDPRARQTEGLLPYVPRFEMVLDDLSKATDEQLLERELSRFQAVVLWLLRDARNPKRFFAHLAIWAALLNDLAQDPSQRKAIGLAMRYIATVVGEEHLSELRERLSELAPAAEETMPSIAESWERKGIEKGIEKGRAEGRAEGLLLGIELKFGVPSEATKARIEAATAEQLTEWLTRLRTVETLEALFED